jgi:VanZ family protein
MARSIFPASPRERRLDIALWIATLSCACATLYFSFGPWVPFSGLFPGADKVEHALAYGTTLLCFMLAADWRPRRGDGPFPRTAFSVAILAIAAGIVIEWLQGRYFHRDPEVLDIVGDMIGSFGAFAIFTILRRRVERAPERATSAHEATA